MAVAALTIIRAWIAVGRPRLAEGSTASFEAWDELVRQPVLWVAAEAARADRALPGFGAQLERALGQAAARIVAREEPQTPPTPPAPGGGQLPLPIAIPAASAQVA